MKTITIRDYIIVLSSILIFYLTAIGRAHAEWPIATSVIESQKYFSDRQSHLVQKRLDKLHLAYTSVNTNLPEIDRWVKAIGAIEEGRAWESTTLIASGLLAIKEKRSDRNTIYQHTPPEVFISAVEKWTEEGGVHRFNATTADPDGKSHGGDGDVGTGGDYDFAIRNMLFLIYAFKNDNTLLTDKALFNFIDKALFILAGKLDDDDRYLGIIGFGLKVPETENHVLMIVGGRYLINQFILNIRNGKYTNRGGVKKLIENSENYSRKLHLKYSNYTPKNKWITVRLSSITQDTQEPIKDLLLEASGRILHNGFFETNSRPYQGITFHALLNVYNNSDDQQLKIGMRNALDYLSTKYTFQSLNGYRISPMRRNNSYANRACAFITDDMNEIMSFLNGKYPLRGEDGGAFWTSLSSYRIPQLLLDISYEKDVAYQARMQSRFPLKAYSRTGKARYFYDDLTPWYSKKQIVPAAELYFKTENILNVSGGSFLAYPNCVNCIAGNEAKIKNSISPHDFQTVPQTIITEGHQYFASVGIKPKGCGRWGWGNIKSLSGDHPVMDGRSPEWWTGHNSGTYKGFSYGFSTREEDGWPQLIPRKWNRYIYRNPWNDPRSSDTWTIGNAKLKFFDFSKNQNGISNGLPEEVFIIMGKIMPEGEQVNSVGFWDIIPAARSRDVEHLRVQWSEANSNAFKRNSTGHYKYLMNTGEVLILDAKLHEIEFVHPRRLYSNSSDPKIIRLIRKYGKTYSHPYYGISSKSCFNPIKEIIVKGKTKKLSDYISDRCSSEEINLHPLIEVKEIDKNTHQFKNNRVFAYANGDGKLIVRNFKQAEKLEIDSSNYKSPQRKISYLFVDTDEDSIADKDDNCPETKNLEQEDLDSDGVGDICDNDIDGDGVANRIDNCIYEINPDQKDTDSDKLGDACDIDDDNDCIEDVRDNCQFVANCNYYAHQANKEVCTSPCDKMAENQFDELQQLLRDVNISCSINNIDPLCERDGCPWPELMKIENIRIQPIELIRSYVDKFPEEITGIRGLPNNRMSFTANENLIRGGNVTLPGGHNVILLGGNRVLCEENTRRLNSFRPNPEIGQCIDQLVRAAEKCQLDTDGDGVGDACPVN